MDSVRTLSESFLLVAASEMGDKTQLLAFVLATRFRNPLAIIMGILTATILNHGLAALLGSWVSRALPHDTLKWILGGLFIAFAGWILVPDKDEGRKVDDRWGAYVTTTILFFLAEIGDKTQLATMALAARFNSILWVTAGTTLGMLFSDGLAVIFGEKLTERIPMNWIRRFSALLFVTFGVAVLMN